MQIVKKPFLKLQLTPQFDSSENAISLSISQTIETPNLQSGETLYIFSTKSGNLPSFQHRPEDVQALDSAGPLSIHFRNSSETKNEQEWYVDRPSHGDVTLKFVVTPRAVNITTPMSSRVDLRSDQGGLQGGGSWFLPRPNTELFYRNIVEWDLSKSPVGTRAVWSFGEGPEPVEKEGNNQIVNNTIYIVGPIQSYPEQTIGHDRNYASIYWFGKLPLGISNLKNFNSNLFRNMAAFFNDLAGPSNTYSTFVRKVLRGFGGTGLLASYVLEYDEDSKGVSEHSMAALLTHEMVHSWAILDDESDGYGNYWYEEGIANFYAASLPFRFNLQGVNYFQESINGFLTAYFTSPSIHISNVEAWKNFWKKDWYAVEIPYNRGFVYFLMLDHALAQAAEDTQSSTTRPLDKIVTELAMRRMMGEKVLAKDWLELLYPYLGKERADKDFEDMSNGKVLDLSNTEVLGHNGRLVETQQEVMEFGFDRQSLDSRKIIGLKKGSRAALAGLQEGDNIVWNTMASSCKESFETNMRLIVERDGKEFHVEYWPRSFEMAPSWQLVGEK